MHSVSGSALVQDFQDFQHCTFLNEDGSWQVKGIPEGYLEVEDDPETVWRSTYPTVSELAEKVEDVLEDQVRRGQVLKHTEEEAKRLYPGLVIASLGQTRRRRATERTRVRDQERCPMASHLKRGTGNGRRERSSSTDPSGSSRLEIARLPRTTWCFCLY